MSDSFHIGKDYGFECEFSCGTICHGKSFREFFVSN